MKARIYITQKDNDALGQKLPTWKNGFCYIERDVFVFSYPSKIYEDGEYGIAKISGKQVLVTRVGTGDFEVHQVL